MAKELSDLSAHELARVDAICLDFEAKLRERKMASVDADEIQDIVKSFGGEHSELLRRELLAVAGELSGVQPAELFGSQIEPIPPRTSNSDAPVEALPAAERVESASEAEEPPEDLEGELPRSGETIGPYRIEGELGRGGMGIVYRAIDTRLDRAVAIKMLSVGGVHHAELVERFQREAKAVAQITHPNIVELFDVGKSRGLPYAVMEILDGQTLMQRFGQDPLSTKQVRQIGVQIADALATSHAAGVIHRDLKPHNVMLMAQRAGGTSLSNDMPSNPATEATLVLHSGLTDSVTGDPSLASESITTKLFDFGLSRFPKGANLPSGVAKEIAVPAVRDGSTAADRDDETRAGMILGTPGYMAPEQARGEAVTPAADLFSLGCVLFEAFYGRRAFEGPTSADRFAASLHQEPVADPIRRQDDPQLADLIDQCLQKDVDRRPGSAAEIVAALGRQVTPAEVSRESGDAHFGRRRFIETVAGGVAGIIASGFWQHRLNAAMSQIQSIGVLTFTQQGSPPISLEQQARDALVQRAVTEGEQLSVALVNELSQVRDLTVAKFFPMQASNSQQYKIAASNLDVDALVDGQFRRIGRTGASDSALEVDLQIISADSGKQLWGDTIRVVAGDSLLERKMLATSLAKAIGRGLSATSNGDERPADPQVFSCINKGQVNNDPDDKQALESALACFDHALTGDAEFAESHAGVALFAMMLANLSDPKESIELIDRTRVHAAQSLALAPTNVTGLLADAMLKWQVDRKYDQARATLEELSEREPNAWQVHHQYGLLLLTFAEEDSRAIEQLGQAARLARMSKSIAADVARAEWFRGERQRAIDDATIALTRNPDDVFARGLLIDLHEEIDDFELAASVDPEFGTVGRTSDARLMRDAYFDRRAQRIEAIPYGAFGLLSNQIILSQRRGQTQEDRYKKFNEWTRAQTPSMPLLLARHSSTRAMRLTDYGKEILPR